jgi:hypothetical protein
VLKCILAWLVNDVIADVWCLLSVMVGPGVGGVLDEGFFHNLEHHACNHILTN